MVTIRIKITSVPNLPKEINKIANNKRLYGEKKIMQWGKYNER